MLTCEQKLKKNPSLLLPKLYGGYQAAHFCDTGNSCHPDWHMNILYKGSDLMSDFIFLHLLLSSYVPIY